MIEALKKHGVDPNGDPIPDPLARWRIGRCLSMGFFYRWVWPGGVEDREWLSARRNWHAHVRDELSRCAAAGYDSEFLVRTRVGRELDAGQKTEIHRALARWRDQRDKPPPPTEPVWLSADTIRHVADLAFRADPPVMLWYDTQAVAGALTHLGLPVYGASAAIENRAHTCAVSIAAHGESKNLQSWAHALVLTPPSSGRVWEQLLGRHHRTGQRADTVHVRVLQHAQPCIEAFAAAVQAAKGIEQRTGNPQRLVFATYSGRFERRSGFRRL
jgi:hypothetical protein